MAIAKQGGMRALLSGSQHVVVKRGERREGGVPEGDYGFTVWTM
ncbi:hypothetical protein JCM19237_4185 [Photobacterium aphoticum]|uniref:Uncharacterized protein n=1 Tax=Photobacterium aphoticum TaxID=754436 RepID=A0A090QSK8_9GAMM|nr:hypothetical protein JCM19237_4185 [Photobacterium aphoticum]